MPFSAFLILFCTFPPVVCSIVSYVKMQIICIFNCMGYYTRLWLVVKEDFGKRHSNIICKKDDKSCKILLVCNYLSCYNDKKHILQNLYGAYAIYILETADYP